MKTSILTVIAAMCLTMSCQVLSAEAYNKEKMVVKVGAHKLTLTSARTLQHPLQPARYSIRNLFDNNKTTAWVTRFTDDPVTLEEGYFVIEFDKPVYVKNLYIRNGYQRSNALFQENERVKTLSVEKVIAGGRSYPLTNSFDLPDTQKEQKISLTDDWTNTINLFKTRKLIVSVLDIYKGGKYQDLCISDLRVDFQKNSGYQPSISWKELKEKIDKNAIKTGSSWDWSGLNAQDYRLFTDFLYYTLSGNPGARKLFSTYQPSGTDQSEAMESIYRKAVAASR